MLAWHFVKKIKLYKQKTKLKVSNILLTSSPPKRIRVYLQTQFLYLEPFGLFFIYYYIIWLNNTKNTTLKNK